MNGSVWGMEVLIAALFFMGFFSVFSASLISSGETLAADAAAANLSLTRGFYLQSAIEDASAYGMSAENISALLSAGNYTLNRITAPIQNATRIVVVGNVAYYIGG